MKVAGVREEVAGVIVYCDVLGSYQNTFMTKQNHSKNEFKQFRALFWNLMML